MFVCTDVGNHSQVVATLEQRYQMKMKLNEKYALPFFFLLKRTWRWAMWQS